jgi:DNA repair photolyase
MGAPIKGRGASEKAEGRFEVRRIESVDDGWWQEQQEERAPATSVRPEIARSIISHNESPDLPFSQSINPYRGCEHGCIYCYARPSHAYLNLSPGLDFETRLFYKANTQELLERELSRRNYQPSPIQLGANTDPYQPIERELKITRGILQILLHYRHPVTIVTKSHSVVRDLDLLSDMSKLNLCRVMISVTTLDEQLKRSLEPRAPSPAARLKAVRALSDAGVPVGVLASPMIPAVNDHELEQILGAAAAAGALSAGFIILRLPNELKDLFENWLRTHLPLRADHVLSRIRAMREGRLNDSQFGTRFKGVGVEAELLQKRFEVLCRRLQLDGSRLHRLDCSAFRVPPRTHDQLRLDGI